MDKRRVGALMLIPLAMMFVVPVASHAQGVSYGLFVSCDSYSSKHTADTASLVFLGHGVSVFCRYGAGYHSSFYSFASSMTGTYRALMDAGSNIQSEQGTFGPLSCFAQGEVYDNIHYTWAYFEIQVDDCSF